MIKVYWISEQQQLLIFSVSAQYLPRRQCPQCAQQQFGAEPVEIVSTAEKKSPVPISAPLPLLILTAEKENKHAGPMEKEMLCYKNKQREIESVLLNLTAESINLQQLEEDAS